MGMDTAMGTGMGEKPASRHKPVRLAALLGLAFSVPLATAQETGQDGAQDVGLKSSVSVVPRMVVTETWTDNLRLSNARQSEQITELSPGIRVNVNKARIKGFFDYALTGVVYAQATALSHNVNALSSALSLEAVDNTVFVDASGSISQQAVSAFGTQSLDNTSINANRTEVSTYRISPYVQGRVGDVASYQVRYSRAITSSAAANAPGVATDQWSLGLKGGGGGFRSVNWTVDASRQSVSYSAGRATENDSYSLGLSYAITPQFSVSVDAGAETNNYTSLNKQTDTMSGLGLSWSPLDSTRLSANQRHHAFGDTFQINFDHRTGRTVWHFSDSREVTQTPTQQSSASLGSAYDLYYAQFAGQEPNPVARAQLVNAYLQTYGIAPNTVVSTGVTASSLSLQRRQQLSFAILGVRDNITFIATQSESNRLDPLTLAIDDFTSAASVRQQGLSINLAHRLTPAYSLGLLVSQIGTTGTLSSQSTTLKSVNFSLTGKIGKQSSGTLGLRKGEFDSSVAPYSETAMTIALNLQW